MSNRLSKVITDEQLNRGMQIESAGNPEARSRSSSAAGLGQFLKGTWNTVGLRYYPDEVKKAGAKWADMRVGKDTALLQMKMMARFWEENAQTMRSTRDGDLYLAHFLGSAGARRVIAANQGASAVEVCGEAVAAANKSIFYGRDGIHKTCAELRAWADASMRKRWDASGRKDWVTIWGGAGLAAPPPDAPPVEEKKPPSSDAGKVAGGVAGGAAAGGAIASWAGLDWGTILVLGVAAGVTVLALILIIRAARRSGG